MLPLKDDVEVGRSHSHHLRALHFIELSLRLPQTLPLKLTIFLESGLHLEGTSDLIIDIHNLILILLLKIFRFPCICFGSTLISSPNSFNLFILGAFILGGHIPSTCLILNEALVHNFVIE